MRKQSFLHLFSLVSGLLSLFILFVIYYELIYGCDLFIDGFAEWSYSKYHSVDFVITSLSYFSLFISLFSIGLFYLFYNKTLDWYKNKYFVFIVFAAFLNAISSLFLFAMAAAGSPNFG